MKQPKRSAAAPVALAAVVLSVVPALAACSPSGTAAPATSPAGSGPAASGTGSASADPNAAAWSAIESQVAELRGLALKTSVPRHVVDRSAALARLTSELDTSEPAATLAADEELLQALNLLPAGASLRDEYLGLIGSQVLGFYEPDTKSMYVVTSATSATGATPSAASAAAPGPLERSTYAHEFTHALQDQAFDLGRITGDFVLDDRALAQSSVIEGDATLLMTLWMTQHLSADELAQAAGDSSAEGQQGLLDKAPRILRDTLLFPYSTGASFVNGIWRSGGWKGVDALYSNLPTSTAQVLHPELYASGWKPATVTLPSTVAGALGNDWSLRKLTTVGEATIGTWLQANGIESTQATAAAAGWAGDRIVYLSKAPGTFAVAWKIEWTTATDAAEFTTAATAALARRDTASMVVRPTSTETVIVMGATGVPLDALAKAAE